MTAFGRLPRRGDEINCVCLGVGGNSQIISAGYLKWQKDDCFLVMSACNMQLTKNNITKNNSKIQLANKNLVIRFFMNKEPSENLVSWDTPVREEYTVHAKAGRQAGRPCESTNPLLSRSPAGGCCYASALCSPEAQLWPNPLLTFERSNGILSEARSEGQSLCMTLLWSAWAPSSYTHKTTAELANVYTCGAKIKTEDSLKPLAPVTNSCLVSMKSVRHFLGFGVWLVAWQVEQTK